MADADRCVFCEDIVPEGRQMCPACENALGAQDHEAIYDRIVKRAYRQLDLASMHIKTAQRSLTLISGGHKEWQ